MRSRKRATIQDLRVAIDCLPRATRIAMLRGISANPIIAGAYTDGDGICPMLAAHRCGGRTSFISFARAWDNFAFRGKRARRARRATDRELLVLRTHLEASLLAEEAPAADLAAAVADHRELVTRRDLSDQRELAGRRELAGQRERSAAPRVRSGARPGDPDRSRELHRRGGWRWMRIVRSLDDYERALEALGELESEQRGDRQPVPA
jgi:hypothetical protein